MAAGKATERATQGQSVDAKQAEAVASRSHAVPAAARSAAPRKRRTRYSPGTPAFDKQGFGDAYAPHQFVSLMHLISMLHAAVPEPGFSPSRGMFGSMKAAHVLKVLCICAASMRFLSSDPASPRRLRSVSLSGEEDADESLEAGQASEGEPAAKDAVQQAATTARGGALSAMRMICSDDACFQACELCSDHL